MGLSMYLKIALLIVALITVGVGLYAHFTSEWLQYKEKRGLGKDEGLHEICENWDKVKQIQKLDIKNLNFPGMTHEQQSAANSQLEELKNQVKVPENCPAISLEQFFVAATIICFLGVIVSLLLACCFCKDPDPNRNKTGVYVDAGFHVVLALLLFSGAICFFVSAIQAHEIYDYFHSKAKGGKGRSGRWSESEVNPPPDPYDPYDPPPPYDPYDPPGNPPGPGLTPGQQSDILQQLQQKLESIKQDEKYKGAGADDDLQMNYEIKLAGGAIACFQVIFHIIVAVTLCMSGGPKGDALPGPYQSAYSPGPTQQQPYGYPTQQPYGQPQPPPPPGAQETAKNE